MIKTTALKGVTSIVRATASAEARITHIEITKSERPFAAQSFGGIDAYERLTGSAYGEIDPAAQGNPSCRTSRVIAPRIASNHIT